MNDNRAPKTYVRADYEDMADTHAGQKPMAMPSWSWSGLALLAGCGIGVVVGIVLIARWVASYLVP